MITRSAFLCGKLWLNCRGIIFRLHSAGDMQKGKGNREIGTKEFGPESVRRTVSLGNSRKL